MKMMGSGPEGETKDPIPKCPVRVCSDQDAQACWLCRVLTEVPQRGAVYLSDKRKQIPNTHPGSCSHALC